MCYYEAEEDGNEKLLIAGDYNLLKADGWYEVNCVGDHHQFKHPRKSGRVTITHPKKDIPIGTIKQVQKQAVIKLV